MKQLLEHLRRTLKREHLTWAHLRNWTKLSWLRLRMWFAHVWVNPAPRPDQIGKPEAKGMRPVHLEFRFTLQPDGKVYMANRFRGGQERVTERALIGLVHREYRLLVTREYIRRGLKPPRWTNEESLTPESEER